MGNRTFEKRIGLCGHIGVGHIHSHSGFVQDDGAGFSVLASLLKESYPVDTRIKSVKVDLNNSLISIVTNGGGKGEVFVPSGLTPWEKTIIEDIVGLDGIYNQQIVLKVFGRIYGQGAMETAVSLQGAIAFSLVDSFCKSYPDEFMVVDEDIPENNGKILGTLLEIEGVLISLILTVNSSLGGLGPVEDLEGNIALGKKGELMKKLGLDKVPTIIVESKNYSPGTCDELSSNTFLVRANSKYDNITVAESLVKGADSLKLPCKYDSKALLRGVDTLLEATTKLGEEIIGLGQTLKEAQSSREKVKLVYRLNKLAREDAGGVTFMSNDLNKSVGGAGMLKGTSAVLSLLVTKEYIEYEKIPFVTEEDINNYINIIKAGIKILASSLDDAVKELEEKWDFEEEEFKYLFQEKN